jgi:hypothetical protein
LTAKILPLRRPTVPRVGERWLSWLVIDELNHAAALAAAQDDSPLAGEDADDEREISAYVATLTENRERRR